MKMPIAVISGITGQDGAYLSKLLLDKGYVVYGLVRSDAGSVFNRLTYLGVREMVELLDCDLCDLSQVIHILQRTKPDEFYNLAAQSSVSLSFQQPIGTLDFNIRSVLNVLEAIRIVNKSIRFYQASSSEMFGRVEKLPITEEALVHPLSPYAISKIAGHHISINYRESYGLFTCSGILFNHESYLRGAGFFMKKLIRGSLDIIHGRLESLEFGNLDIKRDFGWSVKYVEAMWMMMQHEKPDDFVICSGESVSLRSIVEYVYSRLNIPRSKIIIHKGLFRPTEIVDIYGSNEKAKRELGWEYNMSVFEVVDVILEEEARNYGNE